MKPAALVAAILLDAIATLHLLRLVLQLPITVGAYEVPVWLSVFGVLGPGALAVWLFLEQRRSSAS